MPDARPYTPAAGSRNARQLVLLSMLGLSALNFYRAQQPENDVNLYRRMWGTGVVAVMLSALCDVAPSVGGPFAVLVLLGALTQGGDKALQNMLAGLSKLSPAAQPAAPAAPVAPHPASAAGAATPKTKAAK